jgi:hypothetical protein
MENKTQPTGNDIKESPTKLYNNLFVNTIKGGILSFSGNDFPSP